MPSTHQALEEYMGQVPEGSMVDGRAAWGSGRSALSRTAVVAASEYPHLSKRP